ncbi:MAG: gamma-glutamyltransferase [Paracoccaceae bacterium]
MRDFHRPGRSAVFAGNGMCATSHPLAAHAAIDILKSGGNAMDAAIAGAVLLGLCEPQMTGIGGDCFVLFSPPGSDDIKAMNGSGCAPSAQSATEMRSRGLTHVPEYSAEAVTIPGAIDAFCQLSNDWGKLGLEALLAPAIDYAEKGVPVAPRVALDWAGLTSKLHVSAQKDYLVHGKAPLPGDMFYAPKQAKVLRQIAAKGRDGFYRGEVADDMVQSLAALGGAHRLSDFANQHAFYTDPIRGTYHGVDLVEHPPNGQGATAILLLNILSQFDLAALAPFDARRTHIETEATKLAYQARNAIIADPANTAGLEQMLSVEFARKLADEISLTSASQTPSQIIEAVHKDTIYITVVDQDRMSVSLIYSIFHGFGSGLASKNYGILFQNRGAGFNLIPNHPNELKGGARPMHTIIPGMLCDAGKPIMPFGVMGGQYQPTGHARVISNILDFGLSPQDAIDAPRSFFDNGTLKLERGYEQKVVQELADLGHAVTQDIEPIGGAQAIRILQNGVLEGASDPRKDGCALGY